MSIGHALPESDVDLSTSLAVDRSSRFPILATLAAVYTALVAPAQVAALNPLGSTLMFLLVAAAGLVAMLVAPRSSWFVRNCLAVVAGVGTVVAAGAGRTLLVWVTLALVLTVWTVAGRRPVPFVPVSAPGSAIPVVVASFLAVRAGSRLGANWQPLVILALGGLVALVWTWIVSTGPAQRLEAAGHAVDRALTRALLVPVAAVTWLLNSAGSLIARRDTSPGWSDPSPTKADRRSLRSADRPARRLRPWTVPVAVVAVLGLGLWFGVRVIWGDGTGRPEPAVGATPVPTTRDAASGPDDAGGIEVRSAAGVGVLPPTGPIPEAYRGDEWFPSFRRDMAWVMDERVAWRPMNVQRVLDVTTPTVNVRDRERATWTPPPGDGRPVTVWLYGGSGAFGVGQRDEHTIASELAKAAAAEGVALDVRNRGIPGQMHWRNSTRLAWDLTQSPPPDLVLFYEGAEEVASELELRARGLGNTVAPFESFITNLYDEVAGVPEQPPPAPDGVSLDGWPTVDATGRRPGELAADRYQRSRAMSRWTTGNANLPVRYYWQPSRYDRGGETVDAARAAAFVGAGAALPDDVRDLSGTLTNTDGPVFYDDPNHNEQGAALVAAAIWKDLRDQLTALARESS
ncbi:MAG: hypothetical protein ACKO04_02560 [Actinomycetes bacterium]